MGVNICVRLKHTWAMLEVIVRSLCSVQLMPASMAMLLASLITGTSESSTCLPASTYQNMEDMSNRL